MRIYQVNASHGRVIGIQDVIDFYGRVPDELRKEFKNSVKECLVLCTEEGTKPEKTWLGKLTIRVMGLAPATCCGCYGEAGKP